MIDLDTLQKEIENDSRITITVPSRLSTPHPLIAAARTTLDNDPRKDYQTGMVSTRRDEIAITVSPEFVGRALLFLDTLIKVLIARGHRIYIDNDESFAFVNGRAFKICYRERAKRTITGDKFRTAEFHASGVLYFKAQCVFFLKEWDDGKVRLEEQLSRIVATMEAEATSIIAQLADSHIHVEMAQNQRAKELSIEKDARAMEEKELTDFEALLEEAQDWQKISLLRSYLDEIEAAINRKGIGSEALTKWLELTRIRASLYDPIEERIREILSLEN
jgi:hypothetical protein